MSAKTIVEAQVDGEQKAKADAVLGRLGLTLGEAIALLVGRIAEDGDLRAGLAADPSDHDAWIATEVRRALADERKPVSNVDVEAHFARRRVVALRSVRRDES